MIELLSKAGCFQIFVGVESFNRKILLAASKATEPSETLRRNRTPMPAVSNRHSLLQYHWIPRRHRSRRPSASGNPDRTWDRISHRSISSRRFPEQSNTTTSWPMAGSTKKSRSIRWHSADMDSRTSESGAAHAAALLVLRKLLQPFASDKTHQTHHPE